MNPYCDFCFWTQDALETRKDITSYFLVRLVVVEYDPEFDWNILKEFRIPKEYVDFMGMKIAKKAFDKSFGALSSVVSENPMMQGTQIPWKKVYVTDSLVDPNPITYQVSHSKLPLYIIGDPEPISYVSGTSSSPKTELKFPTVHKDPPNGTLFEIGPVTPKPFPKPNSDIWNLDQDIECINWINKTMDENDT